MNAINIDFAQFVQIHHSQPVTTSEFVAQAFKKRHADVLRKIDELLTQVPDYFSKRNFALTEKRSQQTFGERIERAYELTKDGFMLLVMGFTGKDAMAIKIAYIEAFNAMADKLKAMETATVCLPHTISEEEAECISAKVLERCGRTGETFQKVYRGLHEYLGVDSYRNIPAGMFATAMRYLDSLPQAPELFRQPEAQISMTNLKALLGHVDWITHWYFRYCEHLRGLNGKMIFSVHDHFKSASFCVDALAKSAGYRCLDREQMQYFPWEGDYSVKNHFYQLHLASNSAAMA